MGGDAPGECRQQVFDLAASHHRATWQDLLAIPGVAGIAFCCKPNAPILFHDGQPFIPFIETALIDLHE